MKPDREKNKRRNAREQLVDCTKRPGPECARLLRDFASRYLVTPRRFKASICSSGFDTPFSRIDGNLRLRPGTTILLGSARTRGSTKFGRLRQGTQVRESGKRLSLHADALVLRRFRFPKPTPDQQAAIAAGGEGTGRPAHRVG